MFATETNTINLSDLQDRISPKLFSAMEEFVEQGDPGEDVQAVEDWFVFFDEFNIKKILKDLISDGYLFVNIQS